MKTKSSNESWQSIRERYTWHLCPPFKKSFEHTHWWIKEKTGVEPVAALYEIARRHPSVGLRITQPWKLKNPSAAVLYLGDLGLKSWPKLTTGQKTMWKLCVQNLKGVDCRTDEEKCFDIAWQHEGEPLNQAYASEKGIPFTTSKIEAGLAHRAVEAFRQGYILLAIAPELETENATALFLEKYREHRQIGVVKQRVRHENWLVLISALENDAASKSGVKSDCFNRYRKVVDGIRF